MLMRILVLGPAFWSSGGGVTGIDLASTHQLAASLLNY
jgi:hypothetical protein